MSSFPTRRISYRRFLLCVTSKEYQRLWCSRNPEKVREYQKQYRLRHPDKYREIRAEWRRQNPERYRAYKRYWRYGVSKDLYEETLRAQVGLCAICYTANPRHTDHNHFTNTFRAILCENCNRGLGMFADQPGLLRKAAAYLESHAAKTSSMPVVSVVRGRQGIRTRRNSAGSESANNGPKPRKPRGRG